MKHDPKKIVSTEDDPFKFFALIMIYLSEECLDAVNKELSQSKLEDEVDTERLHLQKKYHLTLEGHII